MSDQTTAAPRGRLQFSLQMMLIAVLAFALGFGARDLASRLYPRSGRLTLPSSTTPLAAGDSLLVESQNDAGINRRVTVLADGTVSLPLVGVVSVAGQNVAQFEAALNKNYGMFYRNPDIQVYCANASQPLE